MSRIHVAGGTGYDRSNIVRQARAKGHDVTSYSTSTPTTPVDGVSYVTGSVLDDGFIPQIVVGADVVVSALAPRGALAGKTRGVLQKLSDRVDETGGRLGVIGGAGSLRIAPDGPRLVDTDSFPAAAKPEALEMSELLDDLANTSPTFDWFYLSPAASFGAHAPGQHTGRFRTGTDVLLVDDQGSSSISGADLGQTVVDEIDNPAHHRSRFTVGY